MKIDQRTLRSIIIFAGLFAAAISTSTFSSAQDGQAAKGGIPDDWSHRHLVFSDPGTAADALAQGRIEQWNRTVNEPRYHIQEMKRSLMQRQMASAPDFAARMGLMRGSNPSSESQGKGALTRKATLTRDWSMTLGGTSGNDASLTAVIGATINSTTLPASSSFTLDGQTFTSNDPVAASQAGTFTGNPTTSQTLKITSGVNSITLTASRGTAGTQTGTFGAVPTAATATNDSITIQNGATNTLTITTNATGANVGGTMTSNPHSSQTTAPSLKVGANTITLSVASTAVLPSATADFSGVPDSGNTITISSGVQTLTLTAATGSTTGTITVSGALGTTTGSNTLTVGGVTYTFASSCTGASSPCIVPGTTNHNSADNIEAAINDDTSACSAGTCFGGISAPNSEASAGDPTRSGGSYVITITNNYYTNVTMSDTEGGSLSETATIAATTNGCSSATAGTYIIGTTGGATATNLYNVLGGTACQSTYSVPVTVSSLSGGTFKVTETIYGTSSSNAFGETTTNFTWGSPAGNVGTANSCSGSSSPFTASYEAANTLAGLASNVVAAINACASGANIFAVAGSSGAFTVYNNSLGSLSSTLSSLVAGTPSLVTWGTAANGSAGANACSSSTAATFQVLSTDNTAAKVATEFVSAINLCSPASTTGITNTSSNSGGSSATVTITANKWVANPGLTLGATPSGYFSWTAASITNGTNGNGTAPSFAVDNIPADIAANLAADINTSGEGSSVGVTAAVTGAQITISASAPGTTGNGITLTDGLSNITLASPLAGGNDGSNSSTGFAYWSGNSYASQSAIASNIRAALMANSTTNADFTVGTANSPATGDVVLTYNTAGTGGNSQSLTPNFTALTGGTFTGGTAGIQATVGEGQSPAKYSFGTTSASCSDYVVYNTGVAGSASQATAVAYNNIYKTTCSGTVPSIAWAYNTGGNAALSPVLSLDGIQVAYIQTVSSVASLVLLKPSTSSGGTISAPATIGSAVTNANYRACTAPCYTTITLNGSRNDSNSAPFYDYLNDIIWVGDDGGYLHKLTGVFSGTPAEASAGGWPVHVSTKTTPGLTGPVYDSGTTKAVFVNDATGYLYSVTTTGASSQTISTSTQMECGLAGFSDPPIVDSTTEEVYVFVGDGCDATPGNSYVNRFPAGTISSYGTAVSMGNASTNNTSSVMHAGTFDNIYFSGSGTTGNLYVCENGELFQIPTPGTGSPTAHVYKTFVSAVGSSSLCSPLTEFYNGTQDYIFLSVAANGNATTSPTCTGACVYNFGVGAATTGNPTAGLAATGGTSGIVVDNSGSATGESQVYFSTLGSQSCAGNGTTGGGTGGCAVQASQTGLN